MGPRTAIAIRNGIALGGPASQGYLGRDLSNALGRRLWAWKDGIDRAFIDRFGCT